MKIQKVILILTIFYFFDISNAIKELSQTQNQSSIESQSILSKQTTTEDSTLQECQMELLYSYIFDDEHATRRNPLELSDSQQEHCQNMQSTCCTDDEFLQLFERVEQNVNRVKTLGQIAGQSIQDLANLSMFDIENIFRDIDPVFFSSNNLDEAELKNFIRSLQGNEQTNTNNLLQGIRYLIRHATGAVCGLCVPENHNFVQLGVDNDSSVLTIDPEQCLTQLQDPNFVDYLWTLKDMTSVFQIAKVLNEKYQTEHDFDFSFLNNNTFDLLERQRQWCILEENFEETPVQCLQLCGNLGLYFNNPLSIFADPVTTSYVLLRDYATSKSLLHAANKLHEGSAITVESKVKSSLNRQNVQEIDEDKPDFNDLYNRMFFLSYAESFLEPLKNAKYNLETMPQKVNPDCKGFKNYDYGAFVFVNQSSVHALFAYFSALTAFLLLNF